MCFPKLSFESHQSPRNFVVSSTGNATWPIIMLGCCSGLRLGAVKCSILHLCAANLKPFCSAHPWIASTACWRCISMAWRELPRKQMAKSSTNRALKISGGIWRGKSLILRPKQVTANTPPVGTPSSVPNSSDRVTPTRTRKQRWEAFLSIQPCVNHAWYHTARLSRMPFQGQKRDQLLVVCGQRHHGHTSPGWPSGLLCICAFWSHIGSCWGFPSSPGTRSSADWSFFPIFCTGS